jgi:predicted MFS family arabinose efflux permease
MLADGVGAVAGRGLLAIGSLCIYCPDSCRSTFAQSVGAWTVETARSPMNREVSASLRRALTVAATVAIGTVCTLVVNTLPIFLAVLANDRGLTEQAIGFAAMADAGGIALGTTACALLPGIVDRLNWRGTAALGLIIFIAANALSIPVLGFIAYAGVRLLAGIGSGITMAILCAVLAQRNASRDIAIFVAVQLGASWLASPFFTPIAEAHGLGRLFGCIMLAGLLSLLLVGFLPVSGSVSAEAEAAATARERISRRGWIAIASVFLYLCSMGAVLAYLAFMGMAWGGERAAIESALILELLASMCGAIAAAVVGAHGEYPVPLALAYVGYLATVAMLIIATPLAAYAVVVCLFGFIANFLIPFLFEAVTLIDRTSRTAMLFNAATLGGLAIGPAIAGTVLTADYRVVNLAVLAASTLSAILIFIAISPWRRPGANAVML